jgi:hypothetical protein
VLILLTAVALGAYGQSQTGQISGLVTDPAGAAIAGARVQLSNALTDTGTNNTREFITEPNGGFVFPNLLPGSYDLTVREAGFQVYQQKNIVVSPTERVDLHEIRLQIGSVESTITVATEAARLQTASAERSGLVTPIQVETMPNRGRDYLGLLRALPGVLDTADRNAPGDSGAPQVNGGQAGQFLVTLDGVPNQDVGNTPGSGFITPNVDAISEVKVMLAGSQAEFGARSGGQMSVSIKSGTKQFHGSAYYFWRHEMFNANSWNNDRNHVAKPPYRFKNPGGTIGGPIIIPGTNFNKSRDKLFFFFAYDQLIRTTSQVTTLTFPTQAERNGDFSQSYDAVTNKVITLKDPITGKPIPGNQLPRGLWSPAGQALLNLFPLPNATDPSGRHGYNARYVLPSHLPNNNQIARVDWNISPKTVAYGRYISDFKGQSGPCPIYLVCNTSGFGSATRWPMLDGDYDIHSNSVVGTVVHVFTPTLINEATYGINFIDQTVTANQQQLAAFTRDKAGLPPNVLAEFYPEANPLQLVPDVQFVSANGGATIGNSGQVGFEQRFPFYGEERVQTISDNLTYIRGDHTAKFGLYWEHTHRFTRRGATPGAGLGLFNGVFNFGSDPFNGSDTGWGYANALAGVVTQYQESNRSGVGNATYNRFDWFGQDNWKVSRRVRLDYGLRFTLAQPANSQDQPLAAFIPETYKASANPPLILPACITGTTCPSGPNRAAKDPITGQLLPQTLIGALSNAAGTPYQAAQIFKSSYFNTPPIGVSPRLGFAWDVFGDGRLAVRGGFDILYDAATNNVDTVLSLTDNPPATLIQTVNYTTVADMNKAPNFYRVANMAAGQKDFSLPMTLDWYFGVQRDMGAGIVLEVAYVGNTARHRQITYDLNAIAPGTTWTGSTFTGFNPAVVDPTNGQPLPANFLRPYQGYGTITYNSYSGNSNYNSLQVSGTRRFGTSLTFTAAYTFSRTLNYTRVPFYEDHLSYSPGNTVKHIFTSNWIYAIPNGSRFHENAFTKFALDGWKWAGVATARSGTAASITYTLTGVPAGFNISGSPTTALSRIQVVDANNIFTTPKNNLDSGLNPAAFAIPPLSAKGLGNAGPVLFWGPGFWNFDMSLFKEFKLSEDKARTLEFRIETYNTFNHPNYGLPNTNFQAAWNNGNFGPNTNQYFGSFDSSTGNVAIANTARVVVLAAKIRF